MEEDKKDEANAMVSAIEFGLPKGMRNVNEGLIDYSLYPRREELTGATVSTGSIPAYNVNGTV